MSLRDLGFYLRGRLNSGFSRVANARGRTAPPLPLAAALRRTGSLLDRVALLEGRTNEARQEALAAALADRGLPFTRHPFATFEGRGETFAVEVGHGDRVLVLCAHHDAVPGSPGANDNAAAVAILLGLLDELPALVPAGLRVRLLFPGAEELGYLGARCYARDAPLEGIAGVLSLELCGIGDTLAVWDATGETPFLRRVTAALEGIGLERDETYHVVGRIPLFGSDHRAFALAGLPAYGLSIVPASEVEALRAFILSPVRGLARKLVRRPPPFDTYHTAGDRAATLDGGALDRVLRALRAIVTATS